MSNIIKIVKNESNLNKQKSTKTANYVNYKFVIPKENQKECREPRDGSKNKDNEFNGVNDK